MVKIPMLKMYSIEKLVALGNTCYDAIAREEIKELITDKILILNRPVFFLLNKFKLSDKILREVYAKVILIKLKDDEIFIDDLILDEILSLISLEDLAYYGGDVKSDIIREKCTKFLWDSVIMFEDTSELKKKNARYRRRELINKIKKER